MADADLDSSSAPPLPRKANNTVVLGQHTGTEKGTNFKECLPEWEFYSSDHSLTKPHLKLLIFPF